MLRLPSGAARMLAPIALTLVLIVLAAALPPLAGAASPSPPAPGGDPRSGGEGPGFVGDATSAILVVLAIGLGSAVATALYVRLTRPRARE